jgi:hypothetical protein
VINREVSGLQFIDKLNRAARSGVRSNTGCVFDHTPACVRPYAVRSTSGLRVRSTVAYAFARSVFDRSLYVRPADNRSEIPRHKQVSDGG